MGKRYKVLWTLVAEKDLEQVVRFISCDHPQTALRTLHLVRSKAKSLKTHPQRGRRPPELIHLGSLPFRELITSPWRLLYRIKQKTVEVLGFFDGRRDLEEILFERLSRVQ